MSDQELRGAADAICQQGLRMGVMSDRVVVWVTIALGAIGAWVGL